MKKIITMLILLISAIGLSQNNPINFEAGGNGAAWTWTVFENSSNPPLEIIANPDPTGDNTSATVAKFTALQAGNPWAGVESQHGADIGTFTLDATNAIIKIKVWKPVISNVGIKLVTGPGASTGEILVPNTVTNQWEELTFDFSGVIGNPATIDIDQIVIFPDFFARTSDNIVYFDDITFSAAPLGLPLTFEGQSVTFNDFNGSFTQAIPNPDASGINTSATVAENTVPGGAAFAGVNIGMTYDIITDKFFRMDVWSPLANTPVLLKLENSSTGVNVERQATLTTSGTWEEVEFDFSSEGALTFDSVTVFMNFNMVDPNTQIYYWDNLELFSPPLALPLTFEGQSVTFNDFNGSFTQAIANPDATGINTSATVAENTVPGGAAFAGVNIGLTYDIITDKFFRMDVWSPLANTPVLLKLENSSTGVNVERQATLTTSGTWEEVEFDFSSEGALTFDSVTVFMNFNMVDPNTQIYYWDNLELFSAGPGPLALPLTFEGQSVTFNDFNGSFTQAIPNPDASGINTSATVAENTVPGGAAFAGVNIGLTYDIITDKFFRMDVWSPLANTPVLLKLENSSTGVNVERQATLTTSGTWEEVEFDFSSEGALTFDSVTVFMNFNMVDPNTQIYYWDNLELFSPPLALPLTFEGQSVTFNDFNGSFTQAIANPDATGINTSATVAENTVPGGAAFAGVNITVPVDISVDKGFTMDVWSPLASTPVLLKLENSVTGVNVERQVSLTTTSAWEELTFDFSSEGALTFDSVTVFMNFNMVDPTTQVYYWDNLEQINLIPSPANDECANAIEVSCGDFIAGTTVNANIDDAVAPTCDTTVTAPGVWYVLNDDSGLAGSITITMCTGTTTYDSKLSVYTGDCGAPPLTCVVGNDDTCGLQSEVTFASDGNSTFLILVHGFGGATGDFELDIQCTPTPPPNDMIANSIDVDEIGFPYTDPQVAMPAATVEAGTPVGCDNAGAKGVWYNFIPEGDGTATATIITPGAPGALFSVNNGPLAGDYYAEPALFGAAMPSTPLTEDTAVVIDDDTTGDPNDACDPILNGSSIAGKIAIVRRGACEFGVKALAAENEGAVAVIVVNNGPGDPIAMGGGAVGDQVTIPVVMLSDVDGEAIITELAGGGTVNVTLVENPAGFSSVTFYTAPDENAVETDLVLVDYWDNQCVPGIDASIATVAGQAYYVYVVNHGAVTDIVIDGTNLGVSDNEIEGFVYYPNPAADAINLQSVDMIEKASIFTMLGQKVVDQTIGATTSQLNISHLATGTYIMKVSVNGQTGTYKIIKQ